MLSRQAKIPVCGRGAAKMSQLVDSSHSKRRDDTSYRIVTGSTANVFRESDIKARKSSTAVNRQLGGLQRRYILAESELFHIM